LECYLSIVTPSRNFREQYGDIVLFYEDSDRHNSGNMVLKSQSRQKWEMEHPEIGYTVPSNMRHSFRFGHFSTEPVITPMFTPIEGKFIPREENLKMPKSKQLKKHNFISKRKEKNGEKE
jgi:hypothetical protein